ncbi:MAG: sigma-70 family RNA polymerase sigma factor [Pirellulales bacterium]
MTHRDANQDEKTRRFVALLGAHDRRLFGYILALVSNYADAEELAQKTRLRLWEQFDEYDVEKDFGAWARTIAHYLILAYRKSHVDRIQLSDEALEAIAARMGADEQIDDWQWALQECLGRLNESKRQVLLRYYSTGETLREIATQTGRSFDAVRHSVLRTRLALADCVSRVLRREGL